MRRMNDSKFDSPTNFGRLGTDGERGDFFLDHPLENGIYMAVIRDPVDKDTYTFHLTIEDGLAAHSAFISAIIDSRGDISSLPDSRNIISITQDYVSEGSTIELYKLN